METNGKHHESWYTFIKYEGNEEALRHLQEQFEKIEFYILDDLSVFDLELEHLVSEETAREMINLVVNSVMYHRKFDGQLQKIDLGLSRKDSNNRKLIKTFNVLGVGGIDQFIDKEEENAIPDDAKSEGSYETASGSDNDTDYMYSDSSASESSSSSHKRSKKDKHREKIVEKIKKMKEKEEKKKHK
jgi:hypothetical protein